MAKKQVSLDEVTVNEVIDMALSDHVSFKAIDELYGLKPDQVKTMMRAHLKPARYRAWRDRVQEFGERRAHYKEDTHRASTAPGRKRVTGPVTSDIGANIGGEEHEFFDDAEVPPRTRKTKPKRALAIP